MFLGRQEPTLEFGQKHHFHATILARRRQNGPRQCQTLKYGELRSPDPGVATGMRWIYGSQPFPFCTFVL